MGKPTAAGKDVGSVLLYKEFTATGQSDAVEVRGKFNVSIYGTCNATVQVERSFDGGTTWIALSKNADGQVAAYNPNTLGNAVSLVAEEPEPGVLYRFNCTGFTSGTAKCRLSQ